MDLIKLTNEVYDSILFVTTYYLAVVQIVMILIEVRLGGMYLNYEDLNNFSVFILFRGILELFLVMTNKYDSY